MRKKLSIAGIIVAISVICWLIVQWMAGPSPVLTYNGTVQIEVGKSKLKDLFDGGFRNSENTLSSKKWEEFGVSKDGMLFGNVHIKNSSSSAKAKGECTIFGAYIRFDAKENRGDVLVDGINFKGKTLEQIKELMADYKLTSEAKNTLQYRKKSYNYIFSFKNDVVESLKIRDDTKLVR